MGTISSLITSLTSVYSTIHSGADQRKHQSSASLAFVRGIHRRPVNSPHKWPVTRKMFPFDDVIISGVILEAMVTTSRNQTTSIHNTALAVCIFREVHYTWVGRNTLWQTMVTNERLGENPPGIIHRQSLTHWARVTHICAVKLGYHWFR